MTAAELMAKLEADPEWVARMKAEDQLRRRKDEHLDQEEQTLVRDLAEAGHAVRSVWDLVNTREPYPDAVPVLLRHLERTDYHPKIREGIARALTVKASEKILPGMIDAFRRDPDTSAVGPKAAMGSAIEVLYDDRYVDDVAQLATDPRHGEARAFLAYALAKSGSSVAEEALQQLLSDPQLAPHAEKAAECRGKRGKQHRHSSP